MKLCNFGVQIMSKDSAELRDTSVRIFDMFVTQSFAESPSILQDACWTVFTAAASMLLASKLLHAQSPIKAVTFMQYFDDFVKNILFFFYRFHTFFIVFIVAIHKI